jgi:hypothetical protein
MDDILAYEQKDPRGINGFLHIGSKRKDKPFLLLDGVLNDLQGCGYGFGRVRRMLPFDKPVP